VFYQPHLHPLPIRLVTVCVCILTPLATGGFFRVSLPRTSVLSSCLILVCLRSSFLPCNVIFFYSFQTTQKRTKKSNIPEKEDGKSIFFVGSIMSPPWIKHICPFDSSDFGMWYDLRKLCSLQSCVLHRLVTLPNIWRVCVASCFVDL
jgi:hypothetical protein